MVGDLEETVESSGQTLQMSRGGGKDEHLPRVSVGYALCCQVTVVNEADEMAHAPLGR